METCEILITGQEWPSMPLLPHLRGKSGFSKPFTKVLLFKSRMHFSGKFCIPDITTSVVYNRSQSFASTHFTGNKYLNKRLKGPLLPHPPLCVPVAHVKMKLTISKTFSQPSRLAFPGLPSFFLSWILVLMHVFLVVILCALYSPLLPYMSL